MPAASSLISQTAAGLYVPWMFFSQGLLSSTGGTLGPIPLPGDGRSTQIVTNLNIGWSAVASTNVLCVAELGPNTFFANAQSFVEGQGLSQWEGWLFFDPDSDAFLVKVQSTTTANIGVQLSGYRFYPSTSFY